MFKTSFERKEAKETIKVVPVGTTSQLELLNYTPPRPNGSFAVLTFEKIVLLVVSCFISNKV
jgi:hypothetical protein